MKQNKPLVSITHRRLINSISDLMEIVEGVRNERWQDERGRRLKDTREWCAFYVAFRNYEDAKEETKP
jgi:hypothetical protein